MGNKQVKLENDVIYNFILDNCPKKINQIYFKQGSNENIRKNPWKITIEYFLSKALTSSRVSFIDIYFDKRKIKLLTCRNHCCTLHLENFTLELLRLYLPRCTLYLYNCDINFLFIRGSTVIIDSYIKKYSDNRKIINTPAYCGLYFSFVKKIYQK